MNASKQAAPAAPQSDRVATRDATPQGLAMATQLGNQNLEALLRARLLQTKLTVSDPHDVYEQEADRVAEQVMRMPAAAPSTTTPAALVQRRVSDATDVQRAEDAASSTPTVDAAVESSIGALSGRGSPLPDSVRSFMEPRFSADFSGVRVHTDAHAHDLARSVNAQAFTVGRDVVFGAGRYAPDTESGKQLLAHELTHVVQQSSASAPSMVARAVDDVFKEPQSAVDEWLKAPLDVSAMTFTQLQGQIDELEQFLGRQTTSSAKTTRIDEALVHLHRELDKRNAATKKQTRGRRGATKRGKNAVVHRPDHLPRILVEKTSVIYANPADMRAEYDLIMQWLAVKDLPKRDQQILLVERSNLGPQVQADREHTAAKRHAARLGQALTSDKNPATALVSLAQVIEGITKDPDNEGVYYLHHQGEQIAISAEQAARLRADTGAELKHAARRIASDAALELKRYHMQVELNDDSPSVAFVSELAEWGIHDPLKELQAIFPRLAEGARTIQQDIAAGRFAHAAAIVPEIETEWHQMAKLSRAFQDSYIEGAGRAVTFLQVTAAVSFTIAGSIAAVVAAPLVAGFVGTGGLGVTGIGGAVLTTGGTGVVVGSGVGLARGTGALAGQLAAGHSLSSAGRAFANEGVQGFHDGFLAGAGGGAARIIAPALGVGANVGYQAARRAGANAIVNGTSTMLDVLVKTGDITKAVEAGTTSALLAIPGSLIGGGNAKALVAGTLTAGASAYAGARLAGASESDALAQAGAAMATHVAVSTVGHASDAARVKRGQQAGRAVKQKIRSAAAAIAIGTAEALPRPGFGGPPVVFDHDIPTSTRASGEPPSPTPDRAESAPTAHDEVQSNAVPQHVDPDSEVTAPVRNPNAPEREANGDHIREQVGEITIVGTRRMEGTTMRREIPGLFRRGGARLGIGPILRTVEYLIEDARAAGATRLRMTGQYIRNPNVLKVNRLIERYGGTVTRTDDGNIEVDIPIVTRGEIANARAMVPRTGAARVDHGPSVVVANEAPAILYQLPDGIRLVTVHNGEAYYQSLGQTVSVIDGVESTKEAGAFYRFVGAQEGESPPIPAHITDAEMRRQLDRIHPGWLIKGPGIAPTEPAPELQQYNYRLHNDGVPIRSPAELNEWLRSRGVVPFVDFFRHILWWDSPIHEGPPDPPATPGRPRQQRQQQQQVGLPPRSGGRTPPGSGTSRAAALGLPERSFVLQHDGPGGEFDHEPTVTEQPRLPAIIYKGKGVDEQGRPDPDRIIIAMQSQPVYLSTRTSPTYTGDPSQPVLRELGAAYTFFGVAELPSVHGPRGWIIKFVELGSQIPIDGFHQTYQYTIEGTLEEPEQVNDWLQSRGANVLRDPLDFKILPNAIRH